MATRHITKAKTHVFKNNDLGQVLHSSNDDNIYSKTKSKRMQLSYYTLQGIASNSKERALLHSCGNLVSVQLHAMPFFTRRCHLWFFVLNSNPQVKPLTRSCLIIYFSLQW
jgi:hypothetical protein